LNQQWPPPLRLQASHCSAFRIMCDVPSIAVFCNESIECFLGTASKFFLIIIIIKLQTVGLAAHLQWKSYSDFMRSEVVIIMMIMVMLFWDVVLYSLAKRYECTGAEACETLVPIYQNWRRNIPEYSHTITRIIVQYNVFGTLNMHLQRLRITTQNIGQDVWHPTRDLNPELPITHHHRNPRDQKVQSDTYADLYGFLFI
jgi:hypothetical protein